MCGGERWFATVGGWVSQAWWFLAQERTAGVCCESRARCDVVGARGGKFASDEGRCWKWGRLALSDNFLLGVTRCGGREYFGTSVAAASGADRAAMARITCPRGRLDSVFADMRPQLSSAPRLATNGASGESITLAGRGSKV